MRFEKMSTHRGTVSFADDDMRMHLGLAFIKRDIADERYHFDLLVNLILQVILLLQVKVSEPRIAEGADRREVSAADMVLLGERR